MQVVLPLEKARLVFIKVSAAVILITLAVIVTTNSAVLGISFAFLIARLVYMMIDEIVALRTEREMAVLLRRMEIFRSVKGTPIPPWPYGR